MKKLSIKESIAINESKSKFDRATDLGIGFTAPTSTLDNEDTLKMITEPLAVINSADTTDKEKAAARRSLKNAKKMLIDPNIKDFEDFDTYWRERYKYAKSIFKKVLKMLPAELNED